MRFAIQQRNKTKSERSQAQQKQPHPRFAKDTVVKSHCVPTHKKMHKRIGCYPEKWTRFLIVVADRHQKKALAVYYCILKWLHAAKSSIILVGLRNRSLKVLPQAVWVCGCAHKFFWHAQIEKRVSLNASVFYDWSFGGLTVFIFREIK